MRNFFLIITSLLVACFSGCGDINQEVKSVKGDESITIDNGILSVCYDLRSGTFSARRGEKAFIKQGRFPQAIVADTTSVHLKRIKGRLGAGKAIQVGVPSGNIYSLSLYEALPFVCVRLRMRNLTGEAVVVDKVVPVSAAVDVGKTTNVLRVLGCDGLTAADENRTSYAFLAVAEPTTRAGIVAGWITHDKASGIVLSKPEQGGIRVQGRSEYGKLAIEPGGIAEGETFGIGYFEDAHLGLEEYADAIARTYKIKMPKVPSGHCTWYSEPYGRACDEKHMAELADYCSEKLKKFGFEVLQIDDRWQNGPERKGPRADYSRHRPDGPYPSGMKPTAEKIGAGGLTPGIWFLPFGSDPRLAVFEGHQDWLVKRSNGELFEVAWAGTCLDLTHPGVQEYLRGMVSRITREWGYKYTKIDGLYTGMAVDSTYPKTDYREDDNFGDAVLHNPAKTNVEAFRDGLKLVREAAGDDVFILGCTIAQNMRTMGASFGLVNAMRVGRDIGAKWQGIVRGATMGTRLYFLNKRVWYNDPDCLMLREPLTLNQARAWGSWIAITGQLNMVSEWLPGLPAERLEALKRSIPNHSLFARPVDLFENEPAQVWHLRAGAGQQRKDVIGVFNWDAAKSDTVSVDLDKLNLPDCGKGMYVGFDYWADAFISPFSGVLKTELEASSCRVISIRPVLNHPQLISTSRHITQGVVDVIEQGWSSRSNVLSGKSEVVGGDPYELRIFAPTGTYRWQIASADVSKADRKAGVTIKTKQAGSEVRITIKSPDNRQVSWKAAFKNGY